MNHFDLVICGAGPVGCTIAERAANQQGWKVLIIEKRNHIAGNCYDCYHKSGVMIHRYGPHYFRTNNQEIFEYLSKFTDWIPGDYFVKSYSQGELFNFPINIETLENFYNIKLSVKEAKELIENVREKIEFPQNSEEYVLSKVGRELYEAFYLGYTLKQWERHPKDLDTSVCGRIPVRFNKDSRYSDYKYQVTPSQGFTAMFQKMIEHPNISVMLQTDYKQIKPFVTPRIATVYTGPIDEYFDYELGKLPWRSLDFEFKEYYQEYKQPCVQINYPNDFDYTRTVEIKHVTKQKCWNTVISYEYSKSSGDPYYPVPAPENAALYKKYEELAMLEQSINKVFFVGRLAAYRYYNTDQVIEAALKTFNQIQNINSQN
ncbi:MAG: UDP-galactopyranose mutase [Fischerella sp.]|jgi:UDP-galactopyranose mutase|uniref:UDP-galactopyranose mutase n=1 Tax=Fischerella sp. TaxID=1191 RepID=UPI0017FE26BA|nr:UDP-galactopyranose mutase [Fischerella sp.]NWF59126.1 UDP-galactopyranose mutase [Fischerella sp.]